MTAATRPPLLLAFVFLAACAGAPQETPQVEPPTRGEVALPAAREVALAGPRVLVLAGESGGALQLHVFDLAGARAGVLDLPGDPRVCGLDAAGTRAVVAAGEAGLHVVDVARLARTDTIDLGAPALHVRLRGHFAYVSVPAAFVKVDLQGGDVVGRLVVEAQASGVAWIDDALYASTAYPGAVIRADARLQQLERHEAPTWFGAAFAAAGRLYLPSSSTGTWRFVPETGALEPVDLQGLAVAAAGDRLYTATATELHTYDARTLAPLGSLELSAMPTSVDVEAATIALIVGERLLLRSARQ